MIPQQPDVPWLPRAGRGPVRAAYARRPEPQHPAAQTPAGGPRHPDERLSIALEAARQAGLAEGERTFYVQGWRNGVGIGLFAGAVLGMLATRALIALGQWVG